MLGPMLAPNQTAAAAAVPVVAGTCGMWAHWALLLPVSMAATLTGALDNNTQTLAPE